MEGRFPNLLIIGAMKCGTSSLHDYLGKHPDIFMSEPKEIHYYADNVFNLKSEAWYKNQFITDKKIAGTTPQSYTKAHNKFYKNIPERIYKDSPDIKLIYIVRDPIKRYESHVLESYHCDPKEDIRYSEESGNYWKTSLYAFQLTKYLEYFNRDQILIVDLEDLKSDKLGQLNRIFDFLSVSTMDNDNLFNYTKNSAETKGIPRRIKDSLCFRICNKISSSFANRIGKILANRFYGKLMSKPILNDQEVSYLKSKLTDDVEAFREITGHKFEKWSI